MAVPAAGYCALRRKRNKVLMILRNDSYAREGRVGREGRRRTRRRGEGTVEEGSEKAIGEGRRDGRGGEENGGQEAGGRVEGKVTRQARPDPLLPASIEDQAVEAQGFRVQAASCRKLS